MTAINYADKVMLGGQAASAAYLGSTLVWQSAFKPTQISGCKVWLDASKLGVANGGAVSVWPNLGSGSQPTLTAGVTMRTNALNTNMPVVRFTQGAGHLRFTSGTGVDKDWTLIYVARRWSLRPGRIVAAFAGTTYNSANPNILVGFHGTESECAYVEGWFSTPGPIGGVTCGTDWKMYSADSTATGFARLFSDGKYLGAFGPAPAKGWQGTLSINGYTDDAAVATSQECDCEVAELIMYDRKLTNADRVTLENYLRTKWAPITAFKPTDLSGCAIWLDASQLSGADGAAVTSWPNLGSAPAPLILGSPSPVIRANALGGKKVVKITGGQGRFRFSGIGVDKDYTVAVVARRWSTRAGRIFAANITTTTSNVLFGWWSVRFDCCYAEGWLPPDDTLIDNLDWRWYTFDATSAAGARMIRNGIVLRTGTAAPAKGLGNSFCISGHDDTSTEDADCEIAEVVVFNRKLADSERGPLEQYLRLKWNPPSTAFKPADLGVNMLGWFDASDAGTVVITGAGVSNWINKATGSGLTLTQATDANRPTFGSRAVTIGNPQALAAANAPAAYDIAVFGKPRPPAGNDWRTLLRSVAGTAPESHQIIIENGSTRFGNYQAGFNPAGGLTWDSVYGIAYGRFSSAATALLSRDGGALTSVGVTIGNPPFVSFGAYQGPPPSQGFGDVNEVIFTTYNLESTRQMIEGYIAWKWGVVNLLPANHPYKSAPP